MKRYGFDVSTDEDCDDEEPVVSNSTDSSDGESNYDSDQVGQCRDHSTQEERDRNNHPRMGRCGSQLEQMSEAVRSGYTFDIEIYCGDEGTNKWC